MKLKLLYDPKTDIMTLYGRKVSSAAHKEAKKFLKKYPSASIRHLEHILIRAFSFECTMEAAMRQAKSFNKQRRGKK
jgi:hypothetical protein